MPNAGSQRATIYALCDSRIDDAVARVRYIGQTRLGLGDRLRRHWITALAGAREHRAVWMRSLKSAGADVLIIQLDDVPSDPAESAEAAHIARYRQLGCDLTNRTDGGRGKRGWTVSPETRRKMSESAKRRGPHPPDVYRRIGASIKASEAHRLHLRRLHAGNRRPCRPETKELIRNAVSGEKNGHNVLTWASASAIKEQYARGIKQADLAREYACSAATIHAVVHGLRWVSP